MHSKEPWTTTPHPRQINGVTDFQLFDSNGHCIGTSWHGGTSDRIVACVNTMAGLNPEALAKLIETAKWHVKNPLMRGVDGNLEQALEALEETK